MVSRARRSSSVWYFFDGLRLATCSKEEVEGVLFLRLGFFGACGAIGVRCEFWQASCSATCNGTEYKDTSTYLRNMIFKVDVGKGPILWLYLLLRSGTAFECLGRWRRLTLGDCRSSTRARSRPSDFYLGLLLSVCNGCC